MKRFFAIALMFTLLLSGASYASTDFRPAGAASYNMYMDAAAALNEAESYEMEMSAVMVMEAGGETQTVEYSNTIAFSVKDGDTQMMLDMTVPGLEEQIGSASMVTYYKGGYAYMEMLGMKVKYTMPLEEMMQQSLQTNNVYTFTEDMIKEQSIEIDEDDTLTVNFTIDGAMLDSIPIQQPAIEETLEEVELDFSDMDVSAVIGENGLQSLRMVFAFAGVADGEEATISYDMTITVLQIGDVEIDFPADLDEYMDLSDYM